MPRRIFERYTWWYVQEPLAFKRLNITGGFPHKLRKKIKIPSKDQNFNLSPPDYKVEEVK